mmetsp:Transcript_112903/g.324500  ORF Transcript_112903/g.324500 Transcript_112903/m.324500 type:complete len:248 (+) Transcript_112903:402-1145(+)
MPRANFRGHGGAGAHACAADLVGELAEDLALPCVGRRQVPMHPGDLRLRRQLEGRARIRFEARLDRRGHAVVVLAGPRQLRGGLRVDAAGRRRPEGGLRRRHGLGVGRCRGAVVPGPGLRGLGGHPAPRVGLRERRGVLGLVEVLPVFRELRCADRVVVPRPRHAQAGPRRRRHGPHAQARGARGEAAGAPDAPAHAAQALLDARLVVLPITPRAGDLLPLHGVEAEGIGTEALALPVTLVESDLEA